MNIREARPDEFAAAGTLMVEAYREYAVNFPLEIWEGYAQEIANIDERASESVLLVAEDEGRLAGAVTYYPSGRGGGYADAWPREWAGFRLLAVPPSSRGKGLGRLLTQACIDRARTENVATLALGTTDYMKTARAMYERMGFTHVPDLDYYPVPGVLVYCYMMRLDS